MEDAKLDTRLNLKISRSEMEQLKDLAAANAGYNNSLMVRELIRLAWEHYSDLGLHAPKAVAPAVNGN